MLLSAREGRATTDKGFPLRERPTELEKRASSSFKLPNDVETAYNSAIWACVYERVVIASSCLPQSSVGICSILNESFQ